jgi:hypothetical protein
LPFIPIPLIEELVFFEPMGLCIFEKPVVPAFIPLAPIAIVKGLPITTLPLLVLEFGLVPLSNGVEFIDFDPDREEEALELTGLVAGEAVGRMVFGD